MIGVVWAWLVVGRGLGVVSGRAWFGCGQETWQPRAPLMRLD